MYGTAVHAREAERRRGSRAVPLPLLPSSVHSASPSLPPASSLRVFLVVCSLVRPLSGGSVRSLFHSRKHSAFGFMIDSHGKIKVGITGSDFSHGRNVYCLSTYSLESSSHIAHVIMSCLGFKRRLPSCVRHEGKYSPSLPISCLIYAGNYSSKWPELSIHVWKEMRESRSEADFYPLRDVISWPPDFMCVVEAFLRTQKIIECFTFLYSTY